MCHGQIVSQRVLNARKEHRCDQCDHPIVPGRKFVQAVSRGEDEGLLSNVNICVRCAAAVNAAWRDLTDACMADTDEYDERMREDAKHRGWREYRAWLREQAVRFLRARTGEAR